MRVLHFSDPHFPPRLRSVPLSDWIGKRLTGAVGLYLLKRRYLGGAQQKLEKLAGFAAEQRIDLALCSGDLTVLGTHRELADARRALQPFLGMPEGLITIPGNHDLYSPDTIREDRFGRYFGDLVRSDAPEIAVDGPWPVVRWIGDDVAVVAVNSASPRSAPWRSGGAIPDAQLNVLREVLARPEMRGRFIFVMTHHAPRLHDGRPDSALHGLENHEEFLAACAGIERGAILFGHVHTCFRLKLPGLNPALFDAGSVTMRGREGLWLFDVTADRVRVTRGRWRDDRYALDEDESYDG